MRLRYCKTHAVAQQLISSFGTCIWYDREMDRNTPMPYKCEWVTIDCVEIVDIATQLV